MSGDGGIHLVGREMAGARLRLRVSVDGAEAVVVVRPVEEGDRFYARVGGLAVEYEGPSNEMRLRAAGWVVAGLRGGEIAYERPAPPVTVVIAAEGEVLPRFAGLAPGARVRVEVPAATSPRERIAIWDAAVREAATRGVAVGGIPVCVGGAAGEVPIEAPASACAACLDAPACAGPRDLPAAWLRPRHTTDPLTDVQAVLEALGPVDPGLMRAVSALRELVARPESGAFELSFKARGAVLAEGPRVTCYEPAGGGGRAVVARVAAWLAPPGGVAEQQIAAFLELPPRFVLAVGVAPRSDGLALKLYATPPWPRQPGDVEALTVLLDRLGGFAGASALLEREVRSVGLALGAGGQRRVRIYETLPRSEVSGDPSLESTPSVAWDLDATAPPRRTARYAHFFHTHLGWEEAVLVSGFAPALAARLGRALLGGRARAYVTFIGFGEGTATIYTQVGPHPREILLPR